ncbi:FAD-binding oxidoreductase [Nonomuraea typhae]|uniref:FAD-binding oxidoreductase n=1 Tax=Nonomuraea typhae TaxID=2603600 RepID=A0ABW7ZA54_9ACTN
MIEVIRPGDAAYAQISGSFAHTGAPAYVFRPRSAEEVAEAVRFAAREGLELSVRSGGHHGAGYGTNDGGVVADLSQLDAIEIDGQRVRLGAGATWGQVAETLAPHGLAISSGDTRSVGVGGLLTGGGIGWMVRKYGPAVDRLVAAEVVTASGEIVRASEQENADLFWAIRGGGGHAGVVTVFEMTAERESAVTFARFTYPAGQAAAVLKNWRDALRTADEGLTSTAQLFPAFGEQAPPSVVILAAYAGDDPAAVKPLAALGDLVAEDVKVVPYAEVLEDAFLPPGFQPIVRNRFASDLTDELIDVFAGAEIPLMYREIRAIGGALNRVPAHATAFAHRDAVAMVQTVLLGTPEQHGPRLPAFEALWAALKPHVSGAYGNFLTHPTDEDAAEVYPGATGERLAAIKKDRDPANLFGRNIPLVS